ncbi:hypothetical protein ACWEO2_28450 [Nocardia sp. NPDC004278]
MAVETADRQRNPSPDLQCARYLAGAARHHRIGENFAQLAFGDDGPFATKTA